MNTIGLMETIYNNILNFTLIFTRIYTLFFTISIFRREMATVRLLVSLSMLLALYALLLAKPAPLSMEIMSLKFIFQEIIQTLIGFTSGMLINIAFELFSSTGQIISTQIGLSAASLFDPKFGMITSLTNFYIVVAMIIFFGMNGHLMIIDVAVKSFITLPVDKTIANFHGNTVFNYSSIIFMGGVMISITIIAAILMTNICLAVMSKFAQQFNLFSVGLNMSLIIGLVCIYLTFNTATRLGGEYIKESLYNFSGYFTLLVKP